MEPDLRLLLVRHGHATANRPWTFLGHTDAPLSGEGETQARLLAARLQDEVVDAVYSSPLLRARQTAGLIAERHDLVWNVDELLVEQDFGLWEGMTLAEAEEQFPEDVSAWRTDQEGAGPTEGETLAAVAERARHFVDKIRRDHPEKTVLVVAHGAILNALICALLRTPLSWLWAYRLEVGTVAELLLYGPKAALVRLNDH
jgi:broad specificity phosphatase PhoE